MGHYSYRVLEIPRKGWRLQLISPSGKLLAHGVAEARAKAAAHAIMAWLKRTNPPETGPKVRGPKTRRK
jgi:hypothetical protein